MVLDGGLIYTSSISIDGDMVGVLNYGAHLKYGLSMAEATAVAATFI